jgi:outer membrane scaffolding protein for murein synthesis (MipA/OmpV family)
MHYRRVIATIFTFLGFLLPANALCEEKPLWELGVGAAFLRMPDYRGSDENRLYLLPYPYLIYRGDILNIDKDRISGRIFKSDLILFDVSFYGAVPVRSSHNTARSGMQDLDPTFECGPSLKITLLNNPQEKYKLNLSLPVRAVFSTDFSSVYHVGWVFNPRLIFEKNDFISGTGLNLGISAGPMFADSDYNSYYYSVDPMYATAVRPPYSARGGYGGSTLTVGLNKGYKQLVFNAFVSMDFLRGAVFEDSPLVKTKHSVMSGFTVSWIFYKSAQKAVAEEK